MVPCPIQQASGNMLYWHIWSSLILPPVIQSLPFQYLSKRILCEIQIDAVLDAGDRAVSQTHQNSVPDLYLGIPG